MMAIPFVKASACGNDFIIIDGMHAPPDMGALTRSICDRHHGVGADGVEWLFPAPDADIKARLFNADGGEAELSGNGTRCVAAHLSDQTGKDVITVRTLAGIKNCRVIIRKELEFEFETDMGVPRVGDPFSIKLAFREVVGVPVDMGNPQFVVFVDEFLPGWQAEAAEIGKHHDFKHGVNVEFVRVVGAHEVEIRIFERGVGETQSSGSGSSASAIASIAAGKCQSPVKVVAPGGPQIVGWTGGPGRDGAVTLTGPAHLICRGEFFV